jgi:uncharacterized protein with ATP-grasp and redox domains
MRTHLTCIACLVRQASSLAEESLDPRERERFMRRVLERAARFDYASPPPLFTREIYRILREIDGTGDPFGEKKDFYNRMALSLEPRLREIAVSRPRPLEAALRMAVAGNIIDFGVHGSHEIEVEDTILSALDAPFAVDHASELAERLERAGSVLYVADNAGEIVLDRLLIELIGPHRVTCAVRSAPVINDATLADARQVGLFGLCRVIASGSDAPGTPLELCSEEFLQCFEEADVVIAKGQGNYETLEAPGREIFHLMMVKCPVVSRDLGAPEGSFIIMERGRAL